VGTYLTGQRFPESPDVHIPAPAVVLLLSEVTGCEQSKLLAETTGLASGGQVRK